MKMLTTTTACISVSMTFSFNLPHGTRPKNSAKTFPKMALRKTVTTGKYFERRATGSDFAESCFFLCPFFLSLFPFLSPFYLWEKKKGGLFSALRKSC